MKLYMQLSDVGSGEIALHENDAKSDLLDYGQMVRFTYRGADRGGFFTENFEYKPATTGDNTGRWIKVTGRGPLAILDNAVVGYLAETTTGNSRLFEDMTLADIMIDLLLEAKARGTLSGVTWDFNALEDSVGNDWGETQSLNIKVGTSLLEVMRQFASLGIDFYMGPNLILRAFVQKGTDKHLSVIFRVGQNCQEVTRKHQTSELKNSFLIENPTGVYFEINNTTSQTTYGRREALFNAGQAPDVTAAQRMAEYELDQRMNPITIIAIKVIDTNDVTPEVFVDYDLGDYVGVDFGNGSPISYRIRGIQIEWVNQFNASVTLELNTPEMELALRTAIKLNQLLPGSSGTVSPAAIPQDPSRALADHNTLAIAHSNLNGRLQPAHHHASHEADGDDKVEGLIWITDNLVLTGQTASISATNFTNQTAGRYRVSYYLECTTADAGAGSVLATFSFTDDAGATSVVTATLPLTALGRDSGVFYVRLASGAFTYATTVVTIGSSQYALYITVERMA